MAHPRSRLALGLPALLVAVPADVAPLAQSRVVMMASTIGPIDAGIVGALEDAFRRRTGIEVRHAGAGTGAALEMAKTGSFDLVMVHARALEETDPDLLNFIAVIRVNPARFSRVNADSARRFVDWLVSDESQERVRAFAVDRVGEPLFFPNPDAWRARHLRG